MFFFKTISAAQNGVVKEVWNNINGLYLYQLRQSPNFPDKPDTTSSETSMASKPGMGNNYGLRLTAYYKVIKMLFLQASIYILASTEWILNSVTLVATLKIA